MKIMLSFVPPGGGETGYSLEFELPAIPQHGDYISIYREGEMGRQNFIVRRTWWNLEVDANGDNGHIEKIWVECEFAQTEDSSENHKRACAMYQARTGKLLKFDASMY